MCESQTQSDLNSIEDSFEDTASPTQTPCSNQAVAAFLSVLGSVPFPL